MPLIKSNSALIAFDETSFSSSTNFNFISYMQSMSLDIKINRINSKHIGNSKSLVNQFVEPEITLNLNMLHTKDFFNEMLFGFSFSSSIYDETFLIDKIISNFYNKNSFILFSEIQGNDLIYSNLNSSMNSISLGNLFIENYSMSYKINEIPTVSVGFSCNNLKIDKITNLLKLKNWDESEIQLSNSLFDNLKLITPNADQLVYVMNGLSSSSTFNTNENYLGPNISNLLTGIIQSLDCSINFNRNKLYFFNKTNQPQDRKILLPINGNLKISGICNEFDIGNIKNFFEDNSSFSLTVDILDEVKSTSSTIIYNELVIESFSYSINLNGFLEYSLECSFQMTNKSGIKVIKVGKPNNLFGKIQTSNLEDLKSSDGFFFYIKN